MKIVAISDTHDQHKSIKIPKCDILIVAGDFTSHRDPVISDYQDFNDWLGDQPAKHKIVVAGNHDTLFEQRPVYAQALLTNAIYLQDSGTVIEGIKIWGSPWTPEFNGWAFMKPDEQLKEYWDKIPSDTDLLITHGPPKGILDVNIEGQECGSKTLRNRLESLRLHAHIFGHIHEATGKEWKRVGVNTVCFMNVSQTNISNELENGRVENINWDI